MSVAVKSRPILFSAPMVRAILDGRKTQTRRIVKPQPPNKDWLINVKHTGQDIGLWNDNGKWRMTGAVGVARDAMGDQWPKNHEWKCPYGQVVDRLWVRETWLDNLHARTAADGLNEVYYRADGEAHEQFPGDYMDARWSPSIHMPRWASRITLEITGVRVERLNDISEEDAEAEGIESQLRYPDAMQGTVMYRNYINPEIWHYSPESSFCSLWESINGEGSWDANPWVWCISFRRIEPC